MSSEVIKTTKSNKSARRDKPRHSDKGTKEERGVKKGGGGGKGTWGNAYDDIKGAVRGREDSHYMDEDDPNFDPQEPDEGHEFNSAQTRHQFELSIKDLARFKKVLKSATDEYLSSAEEQEFLTVVKELDLALYHQEIANIVLKKSLDKTDEQRLHLSALLHALWRENLVTARQMTAGFRKLFNSIEDLMLDYPNAVVLLREFLGNAQAAGYITPEDGTELEETFNTLQDVEAVKAAKLKIAVLIEEYFDSEELEEAKQSIAELNPAYGFEVVKKAVSMALDRTSREREMASQLIASASGSEIRQSGAERGFAVLLARVEDLFLDIPDVLPLLSSFIARAMMDEALPPAFLSRLDLSEGDMGYRVTEQAQVLLKQPQAGEKLARVWARPMRRPQAETSQACLTRLLGAIDDAAMVPLPR